MYVEHTESYKVQDHVRDHLMVHIKARTDFDCPVAKCEARFSQCKSMQDHLNEAHVITRETPAPCKCCSRNFVYPRRLLIHYETEHDEKDGAEPGSSLQHLSVGASNTGTESLENLSQITPSGSATFGAAAVLNQQECKHCGLHFDDPTLCYLHKGLHSHSDPWKCNLCGKKCEDKFMFAIHFIAPHPGC
ncbi:unnamed protein product [Gongylonema pulchrum]|uniref:C2H2-type domain-containing protein n=1 Tax=Gongylonema pulchrum TaxID=637853 RepID=A0A183EQG7_9BILA|nr:unnamed protein product [Gongylonema pulchrum]